MKFCHLQVNGWNEILSFAGKWMELKHARRACIQKWDWSRRPREERKDRKLLNDNEIHHICVGTRHKETLKMLNNT
jgi:hypothetical protein